MTWNQEQRLALAGGPASEWYGYAVAVEGDVLLVSAPLADPGGFNKAGSVYVYRYNAGTMLWEEKQILSQGDNGDAFGESVALEGGVLVVGARGATGNANESGVAYVYRDDGTNFQLEGTLMASDGAFADRFGRSVAVEGARVVVGARWDDNAGRSSGSAYIFDFDGTSWSQTRKLVAPDAAAGDEFGNDVGLASGGRAIVGAPLADDVGADSGSAYAFCP
jgi:hypothetical protein